MVTVTKVRRRLTYKRHERRILHNIVRQAVQSSAVPQAVVQPTLTPAQIVAQWEADDVIGSWADREDIQDSAEYARQLRWKAEHRNLE